MDAIPHSVLFGHCARQAIEIALDMVVRDCNRQVRHEIALDMVVHEHAYEAACRGYIISHLRRHVAEVVFSQRIHGDCAVT